MRTITVCLAAILAVSGILLSLSSRPAPVAAASLDAVATWVDVPDEMLAGHTYPVNIAMRNTGSTSWSEAASFRLASLSGNELAWSQWKNDGYASAINDARAFLVPNASIATEGSATFNFTVTAPVSSGTYAFGAQMVRDGVAFFGDTVEKDVDVKQIVLDGLPKRLKAGAKYEVTMTANHTGGDPWTQAAGFKLAKLDSNFVWESWENGGTASSAELHPDDMVDAGAGVSFRFTIQAPSAAGTYLFSAKVQDGVGAGSELYTRSIEVQDGNGIHAYEAEQFLDGKSGTGDSDGASGGSFAYTAGAGNTSMWKGFSAYTDFVDTEGEYNLFMRVKSSSIIPLRLEMYGGGSVPSVYRDFTLTATDTWQWVGPLKVDMQAGYTDYLLAIWKMGGAAGQSAAVDQLIFVPVDIDNAYASKLQVDESAVSYLAVGSATNSIETEANAGFPLFYHISGSADNVLQAVNVKENSSYATRRDSTIPGNLRIGVTYLGQPASGYAKFRFTNMSADSMGRTSNTIMKADGYGRIAFNHGHFFAQVLLDEDLHPGQSVEATFRSDWLDNGSGQYTVKIIQQTDAPVTLGSFTVLSTAVNDSAIISNHSLSSRLEAEALLATRTGEGTDSMASGGSYAYVSGNAGTINMSSNSYSHDSFGSVPGTYLLYAKVRATNHSAMVRMQLNGSDSSTPYYEAHIGGTGKEWETIGPLRVELKAGETYSLAFWRLGGAVHEELQVDYVDIHRYDVGPELPPWSPYPIVGANDSYVRHQAGSGEWHVIEVQQPPKQTELYVKLLDRRQMDTKAEPIQVNLGSNMTTTRGATVQDWTIDGKPVLMSWYYPGRETDIVPNWQAKVTQDLEDMRDIGYNVVLMQLFPQFMFPGSPVDYTLQEMRRLGMKALPSIYYINQTGLLSDKTGIPIRTTNGFVDPSDPQFSIALAQWYDDLYSEYGDVFYVNGDGKTPIMYGEEHGMGISQGSPYHSRRAPETLESMRIFRDWLANKYGTPSALNAAWGHGSSYPAFGPGDVFPQMLLDEIGLEVIHQTPKLYAAKWAEGSVALADFDAFRSYILKERWGDARVRILADHPDTLFGAYTFGVYGLEDINGSTYNYTAQRSGVLAEDLAEYMDFICAFYYTPGQVERGAEFWQNLDVDLVAFIREYGDVAEIYGNSPQMLIDGSYSDIPGLYGRVYANTYSVYPALRAAVKAGAVPGVYAWNDYLLWNSHTANIREDVALFAENVINIP